MNSIYGKFKKVIYKSTDNSYVVCLFKVDKTDDEELKKFIDKIITVTGNIYDLKLNVSYLLKGNLTNHPKYSWQFSVTSFEIVKPDTKDAVMAFLTSSFVKGCGKVFAERIVNTLGENAIDLIKEDYNNLMSIKGMTMNKAMKIYGSIQSFEKNDHLIIKLKELGFSLEEIDKILNRYISEIDYILEGNLYYLKDIFDFKRIDEIYITNFDSNSIYRCKECILASMLEISFNEGSVYYSPEEIYRALVVLFNLHIDNETFLSVLDILANENEIVIENNKYYLYKYYEEEKYIASKLNIISKSKINKISNLDTKITDFEKKNKIEYDTIQRKAIISALDNQISIISGGPGTGKTTIINAIVNLYIKTFDLSNADILYNIALLSPTGRASKKLSEATKIPASTIHRYLKWHKESDTFEYNESNKQSATFVIIDEASMLDISLLANLLKALKDNVKLIFVGDIYQLPSVGPGLVLNDLIKSDLFLYTELNTIYRQSDNSYIPFLAKDIKMHNIDDEYMYKKDDYNFIIASEETIVNKIISSVKYALTKGINEDNMQVLVPMYKGINGIDNINKKLQEVYNPKNDNKNEIIYGEKIYRENDKVLQLVNDADNNVFNGDIGKIINIYKVNRKDVIEIDFDGNYIAISKKDLKNITHAYAISIHKSQGSEFDHVLMPISRSYYIMLYNKLLYTGVSRAKKTLTIIGDANAFVRGISNDYAKERKTSLKEKLYNAFDV